MVTNNNVSHSYKFSGSENKNIILVHNRVLREKPWLLISLVFRQNLESDVRVLLFPCLVLSVCVKTPSTKIIKFKNFAYKGTCNKFIFY